MSHGTDRPGDTAPRDITSSSVANPWRIRVDAEGRPRPAPTEEHTRRD